MFQVCNVHWERRNHFVWVGVGEDLQVLGVKVFEDSSLAGVLEEVVVGGSRSPPDQILEVEEGLGERRGWGKSD